MSTFVNRNVPYVAVSIPAGDQRRAPMRSASQPLIGISSAVATPPGISTRPESVGVHPNTFWVNSGSRKIAKYVHPIPSASAQPDRDRERRRAEERELEHWRGRCQLAPYERGEGQRRERRTKA